MGTITGYSHPSIFHRSKLRLDDVYNMSGGELWVAFAKELMASPLFERKEACKWLAFMSFTRYKPPPGALPKSHSQVLQFTKGHTALGKHGFIWLITIYEICVKIFRIQ